jgi:ABC-2 type transport system permease protein
MKKYFNTIFVVMASLLRRFMRDKTALFFTFLFPLLFLFVFGSMFRNSDSVTFDIAVINRSDTQFSKQFVDQIKKNDVFKVNNELKTLTDAKERMGRGEISSIIELPKSFGEQNTQGVPAGQVVTYFEQANPQTGQTVASVMQHILDGINKDLTQHTDPFTVQQKPTKTANLSSFDFLLSGLLGFTMLSLGIFGLANSLPVEKKSGILRRLRATPLRASQLITATALQYLVVGLGSVGLMFVAGLVAFDFNMRGDYFNLIVFSVLSIVLMFGFGLAIGGWAKNENQSAPLSNLVAFPLMFLSGVFFPRFLMPEWLQGITQYLPLSPIVDGLRYITTEGYTLLQLGPQLLIIGAWIVAIYALAIKLFRWE